MYQLPDYWAGSFESLDLVASAVEMAQQAVMQARGKAGSDPWEIPPLLEVRDGVGIISLKGPLVSGSAGFMRLFGVMGYADFQEALMEGATDKSVKSLLLLAATPGGAVEGVDETSEMLKQIAGLKPVVAFSEGNMLSAGYWIGSAATRRLASRTSQIGSIGVVATHIEYSRQMEKEGVTPTVIRSGKWKALGGPYEPLSEAAKAQFQKTADAINDIFESRVASNLGVSQDRVHDKMGQGRTFMGAEALAVGLIDGVSNLQEAFMTAKLLGRG